MGQWGFFNILHYGLKALILSLMKQIHVVTKDL